MHKLLIATIVALPLCAHAQYDPCKDPSSTVYCGSLDGSHNRYVTSPSTPKEAATVSRDYSHWDIYAEEVTAPEVTVVLHCKNPLTTDRIYADKDGVTATYTCKGGK
jgi:hypothetical protein